MGVRVPLMVEPQLAGWRCEKHPGQMSQACGCYNDPAERAKRSGPVDLSTLATYEPSMEQVLDDATSLASKPGHTYPGSQSGQASQAKRRRIVAKADTDLSSAVTEWLLPGYFPKGQVAVLVGGEGIGKSAWWVMVVSHLTTGLENKALGLEAGEPVMVGVINTEDPWADVRGRLIAAGADMAYVRQLSEQDSEDGSDHVVVGDQGEDEADTIAAAKEVGVQFIVVDAWLDTVASHLAVKDPQQARLALAPWKRIGAATGACVLLLAHTNRSQSTNLRDLYGATYALRQVVRVAIFATGRKGRDNEVWIGPDKSNGARKGQHALHYTVDEAHLRPATKTDPGTAPRISKGVDAGASIQDLLVAWSEQDLQEKRPVSKDAAALAWCRQYVANGGDLIVSALQEAALDDDFSRKYVSKAMAELGYASVPTSKGGPHIYKTGKTGQPGSLDMSGQASVTSLVANSVGVS